MRRPIPAAAIALLIVTTALAGCLGDIDPGAGDDEDLRPTQGTSEDDGADPPANGTAGGQADGSTGGPGQASDVTLSGCQEQIGVFPLPAQGPWVSMLPDGFEPEPFEDVPGTISLAAAGFSCQTASHGEQESGPVHLLGGMLLVQPPQELARSGALHALWIGGNTDDGLTARALQGLGLNVGGGTFTVEMVDAQPAARQGIFHLQDGEFIVSLGTRVGPQLTDDTGYDIRLFIPDYEGGVATILDAASADADGAWLGQAEIAFSMPPPVDAGVAIHRWGEDYHLTLRPGPATATTGNQTTTSTLESAWWPSTGVQEG